MIGTTIGHYKILVKLGEGGMGVVYKAEDVMLRRLVAIKVLPSRAVATEEAKARFVREAQAAASLSHPHIATVFEFGEADGESFLAMEYIDGKSLDANIKKGPLPIEEAVRIGAEVAEGLAKAHDKGIVHRDIKPENIMFTLEGAAKIMDFGLADIRGHSRITQTSSSTMGTVSYMSPEQARGETLDERTDIWSLGIVLFEALTGQLPFPGQYESAILYMVVHEEPQSIKKLRGEVPTRLVSIVEKCLRKEADERYRNGKELFDELSAFRKALEQGVAQPGAQEGEKLEQKRFETERRPVTVLHATIVPDEHDVGELDPESLSAGLDVCFDGLISIIKKYEGMADRILGDRLMAVFGAPVAHENDAERAVRSAQEMMTYVERMSAMGILQRSTSLRLKIGVHSGIVVAGSVGAEKGTGYSVVGDTVNIAAGITDITDAGRICLSGDTLKLVADLVETDEPHSVAIRGRAQEVKVHGLRSLKAGREPGRRTAGVGAFVGRLQEVHLFEESLDRVQKRGEVRIFVQGEAGVGKTRLKSELVSRAQKRRMPICEGKCSAFEINTPYYLWNTFLRSMLHVELETPESEIRSRLRDITRALALEADEPYLASLLSLRYEEIKLEEDEQRKSKIYAALQRLLKVYAERNPGVYLFEDLHWIDRFSQNLLEFILSEEHLGPALIVCLYRPEYGGSAAISHVGERLDLSRLSTREARELMGLRLCVESLPDQLANLLERRSEGNPFFIEEIIKTLVEKEIVSVKKGKLEIQTEKLEAGVPETLQGVILARIDRLEDRIREVLLDASVIGREFLRPILEQIVQKKTDVMGGLKKLESLELVFEKEEAKELEYLFKHYLIQEVAYNVLLQKKRKHLHGLIAQAIEKLYAKRLEEFYEVLAFHYEKAEQWEKAADYLARAGRKMRETFTQEESKVFGDRKEAALEKLFASEAEKSTWFYRLLAVTTYVLMIAMTIFMLSGGSYLLLRTQGLRIGIMETVTQPDTTDTVWIGVVALLYGLVFLYLTIILLKTGSALGRIRVYEVLDDGVSLVFKGGKRLVVPFSEVQSLSYVPMVRGFRGSWKRTREDFLRGSAVIGLSHRPTTGPYRLLANTPMLAAPAKEGVVLVRRKKGIPSIRAQAKIGTNRMKILQEARDLGLTPAHTAQFYEQMNVAFVKWQSKHCVHCASPIQTSGLCVSCGYRRESDTALGDVVRKETITIRPVRNPFVDLLEFLANPNAIAGIGFTEILFLPTVKLSWVVGLFASFGFVNFYIPASIWYRKRKSEKVMAVEISGSSVTYVGNLPYLQGLTVPFQDIVSIRRYSNPWQRLFGLGNIELETRNSVPLAVRMPLFSFFIPSIRNGKDVEQLLRQRCNFLKQSVSKGSGRKPTS